MSLSKFGGPNSCVPETPVGYHVSAVGGLKKAIVRAESIGCDALQMFPSNPRGWAVPRPDFELDYEGRDYSANQSFGPCFFHAPYLINLASSEKAIREKSFATLDFALARSGRTGVTGVVVHAGSIGQGRRRDALRHTARLGKRALDRNPGTTLIIELTAGGGNPVASTPGHLSDLLAAFDHDDRIRLCLDTQHLYAAGFDWTARDGVEKLASEIETHAGFGRLACFHVNDSKTALGSKHDRHAILGGGEIGVEPFARLFAHPDFRGIPLILETPGELEDHEAEIKLLRELLV